MKVALYARESTKDTNLAPPIENQIKKGKERAEKEKWDIFDVFGDNGYSGGDWKRPAWNKLMRLAKGHRFNIVWVWNQDRLARDTEQFLHFYRKMTECGIKVFSETEGNIDMETLGGRVQHTQLAFSHEIFRRVTSDKVKKAYEHKKTKAQNLGQPVKWGRPRMPVDAQEIIRLYDSGLGYRKIAKEVGVSYSTVRRVLQKSHPKLATISFLRTGDLEAVSNNPILKTGNTEVKNCRVENTGGYCKGNSKQSKRGSKNVPGSPRGELS